MSISSDLIQNIDKFNAVVNLTTTTTTTTTSATAQIIIEEKQKQHQNYNISSDDYSYILTETLFSISDYGIFILMLAVSAIIGLYYGFISKRKQNNPEEYILGNREMSVIPIAASLIVSQIAGITMLGLPADVYANGTQYVMSFISMILVGLALIYFYIPIFYELGFTSCFTYLEKRFDSNVKITASIVYTIESILSITIVIYVPALAFNQVTGINLHYVTTAMSALCIFYTTIGGLRAVVWTDTIQFISIIGAVVAVIIFGTYTQGGISNVFQAAERGGRLIFFNMDPNPLVKSTFWTTCIGLASMWIGQKGANQATIQRCLSLPNRKNATRAVWLFVIGVSLIKTATAYVGVLLYAQYENCDPLSAGFIKKLDQILPYYIMNVSSNMPGIPGLFIAGIFAAALSTMSSILNSLAGTIYEDFLKSHMKNINEKTASNIMKVIVVIIGVISLALVFVVERLGAILQLAYSLHGLTCGTSIGIFTVGMINRKVNTKGIITGAIFSLLCVGVILVGSQLYPKQPHLPFNIHECPTDISMHQMNLTEILLSKKFEHEKVPWLFRISFMYYTLIGFFSLIIIAIPVSILTGGCKNFDENLLAPYFRSKINVNQQTEYENVSVKNLNLNLNKLKN